MRVLLSSPEGVNSFLKGHCFGGACKRPATVRRVRTRFALGKAYAQRPTRQNSTATPASLEHPGPASWPDCLTQATAREHLGRGDVCRIRPRAELLHSSDSSCAAGRCRQASVHRNLAKAGLPVHRAGNWQASGGAADARFAASRGARAEMDFRGAGRRYSDHRRAVLICIFPCPSSAGAVHPAH